MARRTRANVPQRQMFGDAGVDLLVRRLRMLGKERGDRHDHARLAVAALGHLVADPRLLDRVQRAGAKAFDRRDARSVDRRHRQGARTNGAPVQVNRARAAGSDAAPELGAGHAEVSRSAHRRGMSASTSSDRACPLIVSVIAIGIVRILRQTAGGNQLKLRKRRVAIPRCTPDTSASPAARVAGRPGRPASAASSAARSSARLATGLVFTA